MGKIHFKFRSDLLFKNMGRNMSNNVSLLNHVSKRSYIFNEKYEYVMKTIKQYSGSFFLNCMCRSNLHYKSIRICTLEKTSFILLPLYTHKTQCTQYVLFFFDIKNQNMFLLCIVWNASLHFQVCMCKS